MNNRIHKLILLAALAAACSGCGGYVARRLAQAPNTFPRWMAPKAPVVLDIGANFLTNFSGHFLEVGPPDARLWYRLVEPDDYQVAATSSNWVENGKSRAYFGFSTTIPPPSSNSSQTACGTIVLLHGYGLSQFAMAPWALRLAQEGWRCVLLDLRGHGQSTGKRIYFGGEETADLSHLLDHLEAEGKITGPIVAFGQSYGATLALHWQAKEPRVHSVIAIAPYAELTEAVLNIRREYAKWIPKVFIKAGLNKLPEVLGTSMEELNATTWLERHPALGLFVAAEKDRIAPVAVVSRLYELALPESAWLVVPQARHEMLPYLFDHLIPPVTAWLRKQAGAAPLTVDPPSSDSDRDVLGGSLPPELGPP